MLPVRDLADAKRHVVLLLLGDRIMQPLPTKAKQDRGASPYPNVRR